MSVRCSSREKRQSRGCVGMKNDPRQQGGDAAAAVKSRMDLGSISFPERPGLSLLLSEWGGEWVELIPIHCHIF